jgi:hypothetical protein
MPAPTNGVSVPDENQSAEASVSSGWKPREVDAF